MKSRHPKLQIANLPEDYTALCQLHMPRPIKDKVDYENIVAITDAMAGHNLSPDQEDYFDLLCRLIEDYEQEHKQVGLLKVRGIEALRHLLEEHNLSAADLSRLLGTHRTLGSMILRGTRKLTLEHVAILSKHFRVSADLFLSGGAV